MPLFSLVSFAKKKLYGSSDLRSITIWHLFNISVDDWASGTRSGSFAQWRAARLSEYQIPEMLRYMIWYYYRSTYDSILHLQFLDKGQTTTLVLVATRFKDLKAREHPIWKVEIVGQKQIFDEVKAWGCCQVIGALPQRSGAAWTILKLNFMLGAHQCIPDKKINMFFSERLVAVPLNMIFDLSPFRGWPVSFGTSRTS